MTAKKYKEADKPQKFLGFSGEKRNYLLENLQHLVKYFECTWYSL